MKKGENQQDNNGIVLMDLSEEQILYVKLREDRYLEITGNGEYKEISRSDYISRAEYSDLVIGRAEHII